MMGEGRKRDRKRARGRKRLVKEYGRERELGPSPGHPMLERCSSSGTLHMLPSAPSSIPSLNASCAGFRIASDTAGAIHLL